MAMITYNIQQNDSLEKVVLVNDQNEPIGLMDKLLAHQLGTLHRAFSVFVFSLKNELLLQKRASTKYHSPNQWANSCCGHPRENESTHSAASRRLAEEMGISAVLSPGTEFIYRADLANNLVEHEYVQFFTSTIATQAITNPFEVSDYLWITHDQLFENQHGLDFAPWFQVYLKDYQQTISTMFRAAAQTLLL